MGIMVLVAMGVAAGRLAVGRARWDRWVRTGVEGLGLRRRIRGTFMLGVWRRLGV